MRFREVAIIVACLAAVPGCAGAPTPAGEGETAARQSILASSTPVAGATVNAPVDQLVLRFSPPARLLEVTVSGVGSTMPVMVTAVGETDSYTIPVSELGPGSYTVAWRASVGGAEHRGTIPFTVR